jgi:hypothetical protein
MSGSWPARAAYENGVYFRGYHLATVRCAWQSNRFTLFVHRQAHRYYIYVYGKSPHRSNRRLAHDVGR